MNPQTIATIESTVRASLAAEIAFPEVIARLAAVNVERYHCDYSRGEITYYLPTGESHVVAAAHESHPTGAEFRAEEVAASVRRSQRGDHTYRDFVRETMAAGCVGYFVQITGRRVIYFGRNGDSHVEHFPPAP
jgi:uncharacterized protein YbcV (DUF1398 family)